MPLPASPALTAANCPPPQINSGFLQYPVDNNTGGTAPVGMGFSSGDFADGASAKLNYDLMLSNLIARYGAGCVGVASGLVLHTGATLNVAYDQGDIMMNGDVQFLAGNYGPLPDNTANVFIYATQGGGFTFRTTPISVANAVYIGNVTTSGGMITAVDYSGVVFLVNGVPVRATADAGKPSDTPPATWLGSTITAGGIHVWNGTSYNPVIPAGTPGQVLAYDTHGNIISQAGGILQLPNYVAKTANYGVLAADSGSYFTNHGAAGAITFTLPTPAANLIYGFLVQDNFVIDVVVPVPASQKIQSSNGVATGGVGQMQLGSQGDFVVITGMSSTVYEVITIGGTLAFS